MSELDFYNYFYHQTEKAYGSLTGDYPTAPQVQGVSVVGEAKTAPPPKSSAVPIPASVPQVYSSPQEDTSASPQVQSFSHCRPVGEVPEGYAPSSSCATCVYFSVWEPGYCHKHDFPCCSHYVCGSYESMAEETAEGEYGGNGVPAIFSENCLLLDVATLEEEELEILAEGWTDKGNVTAETRKKKAVLSEGRFPVFDKRSAVSALKLRGKAKNNKERSRIVSAAARYAPEEAKKAKEEDTHKFSYPVDKQPSKQALFSLVLSSLEAEGDEKSVYGMYEELYSQRYGTTEGAYLGEDSAEILSEPAVSEPQVIIPDETAQPPVPDTAPSSSESQRNRTLYQVAQNRMATLARQQGRTATEEEIEKEYERLFLLRKGDSV